MILNRKMFLGPLPGGSVWGGDTISPHPTTLSAFGASILAPSALELSVPRVLGVFPFRRNPIRRN